MPLDLTIFPGMAEAVCRWFAENGRSLPWRETADPYRIWLSEIMLQQTRIEAAIPYYRRFLEAFPDPAALAAADDGVLMKLWEGLGYYSRARNLKKAAQIIVRDYGGALPPDAELLGKLPGSGEYTAGAVASVAFGLPEPAVDGNVLRVVARLTAMEDDVLLPAVKKAVSDALREIYPMGRDAALFTEGLMELGETVCIPNGAPKCELCPWKSLCRAHQNGTEENYPVKAPPRPRRIEERSVLLLCWGDRWAIRQREKKGLLAGLWEFPNEPGAVTEEELRARFPQAESIAPCGRARHIFTHVEWHMEGWLLDLKRPLPGLTWETAAEIRSRYSIPTALKAYLALIE